MILSSKEHRNQLSNTESLFIQQHPLQTPVIEKGFLIDNDILHVTFLVSMKQAFML